MKRIILLLLLVSQSVFANCWDKAAHYYHALYIDFYMHPEFALMYFQFLQNIFLTYH
jgi:hypothetical protein